MMWNMNILTPLLLVEPENRWIGWIYDVPKKILLLAATVFFFSVLRILWSKLSTTQKLTTLTQSAQENRGADGTKQEFFGCEFCF